MAELIEEVAPQATDVEPFLWISDVLEGSPAHEAGL